MLTVVITALLAIVPGAPSPFPASAQEPVRGATRHFDWEAPAELLAEVRPMTLRADEELEEILEWLGVEEVPRGRIIWVEKQDELDRLLGFDAPSWFAAVTQPGHGRIVMVLRASSDRSALLNTFRHELVHWGMLGIGPQAWESLPAWFHEGVAEVWAEQRLLSGMGVPLGWRAFTGELSPLSHFRDGFGDEPFIASEGYAIAEAFVSRLVRLYGREIIAQLMDDLTAGLTLEQALVERTGLSGVTHEDALRKELASLNRILGDVYPQFFLLLALFTIAVFPFVLRTRRRRRAQLMARWGEDEDALDAEDGEEDDRWLHLR